MLSLLATAATARAVADAGERLLAGLSGGHAASQRVAATLASTILPAIRSRGGGGAGDDGSAAAAATLPPLTGHTAMAWLGGATRAAARTADVAGSQAGSGANAGVVAGIHWLPVATASPTRLLDAAAATLAACRGLDTMIEYNRMLSEVVGREGDVLAVRCELRDAAVTIPASVAGTTTMADHADDMAAGLAALQPLQDAARIAARKHARWRMVARWAGKHGNNEAETSGDGGGAVEEEDVCPICRDAISEPALCPCSHAFCSGCIRWWLEGANGGRCPVCREPVAVRDLYVIDAASAGMEVSLQPLTAFALSGYLGGGGSSSRNATAAAAAAAGVGAVPPAVAAVLATSAVANATSLGHHRLGSRGTKVAVLVRRLCCLPPGDKALVVSSFGRALETVRAAAAAHGIPTAMLAGGTGHRSDVLRAFASPGAGGPRVLCVNAATDCSGLTLTSANHLFIMEPPATAATVVQLTGRIARLGQRRPCAVYHLALADTLEGDLLSTIVAPALVGGVVGGGAGGGGAGVGSGGLAALKRADFARLFGLPTVTPA